MLIHQRGLRNSPLLRKAQTVLALIRCRIPLLGELYGEFIFTAGALITRKNKIPRYALNDSGGENKRSDDLLCKFVIPAKAGI